MINKLLGLCLLFTVITHQGYGCDVCGCGLSNNYMGIMPQYRSNSLGLRYSFSQTQSKHLPSLFEPQTSSKETFQSMELLGRYYLGEKWMLIGMLPMHRFYKQHSDEANELLEGLGDVNILANYIALNSGDSMAKLYRHFLQFGGGLKTPTGSYQKLSNDAVNPNFQLGTGAFAAIANMMYTIRRKNVGLTLEGSYLYHFANKNEYQFGQRFTLSNKFFYWKKWRTFSLVPNAALWFDHSAQNIENNDRVSHSGGTLLNLQPGADVFFRKFSISALVQIPIYQNLSNQYVTINNKYFLSLNYNF